VNTRLHNEIHFLNLRNAELTEQLNAENTKAAEFENKYEDAEYALNKVSKKNIKYQGVISIEHLETNIYLGRESNPDRPRRKQSILLRAMRTVFFLKKGFGGILRLFFLFFILFIFTLLKQRFNIYILIVEYRTGTLLLSSWLPLGKGPSLGCRAEIQTRICLTASRRAAV
jgi:hypothetical protein